MLHQEFLELYTRYALQFATTERMAFLWVLTKNIISTSGAKLSLKGKDVLKLPQNPPC